MASAEPENWFRTADPLTVRPEEAAQVLGAGETASKAREDREERHPADAQLGNRYDEGEGR